MYTFGKGRRVQNVSMVVAGSSMHSKQAQMILFVRWYYIQVLALAPSCQEITATLHTHCDVSIATAPNPLEWWSVIHTYPTFLRL